MIKKNKTYYVQQSIQSKISYSPGRILKNNSKHNKNKQIKNVSLNKKQQYDKINKKVQEQLNRMNKINSKIKNYQHLNNNNNSNNTSNHSNGNYQIDNNHIHQNQYSKQYKLQQDFILMRTQPIDIDNSKNQKYNKQQQNHKQIHNLTKSQSNKNSSNPYKQIYQNDMRYFQEYLISTAKYQYNGINLNWPYYFSKDNFQANNDSTNN